MQSVCGAGKKTMHQISYFDNSEDALEEAEYCVEQEKQSYAIVSMLALIPLDRVSESAKVIETVKYIDPEEGATDFKHEM